MRETIVLVALSMWVLGACAKKQAEVTIRVEPDGDNLAVHVATKPGVDNGRIELTGAGFFIRAPRKEKLDVLRQNVEVQHT